MGTYDVAFGPADGRAHLATLERIHTAWFSGERPPAQPRRVIRDSWARVRRTGLHPANGGLPGERQRRPVPPAPAVHGPAALGMMEVLPVLRGLLDPLLLEGHALLVLADADATVLWRGGSTHLLRRADALRFQPGGSWSERSVGTNAIGTALATGAPVHVHAAEHFCLAHHVWSCAAAPVIDPRTLTPIGAIDLSFLAPEAQASAIALATSLARQAGWELREEHRRDLARLEAAARVPAHGSWALVDPWGWVAAAHGMARVARIRLPRELPSTFLVDGLGVVTAVDVPGGWLLAPTAEAPAEPEPITLRLAQHQCVLEVGAGEGHAILGRRAEILACLAAHPEGLSARELADRVYGRPDAEVAVRAEVSRINRELGRVVLARPYRLAGEIRVADGR